MALNPPQLLPGYFVAMLITVKPQKPRRFTVSDAVYAHAAFLSAISRVDEATGYSLHNVLRHKPFSCALIPGPESLVRIRVVFYAEAGLNFYQPLIIALDQASTLRLGKAVCDIQSIDVSPSEWSGVVSWTDLLEGQMSNILTLRFISPTAIMKTDGSGQRYSALLPDPTDVFLGLHRRWDALRGPVLDSDLSNILKNAGCIIAYHRLETTSFHTSDRLQIGFQGSVTYRLRHSSPSFARSIHALARLAQYTGVGYQTARGMGLVQTHIGW